MTDFQRPDTTKAHEKAASHIKLVNQIMSDINKDPKIADAILVMEQSYFLISSQLDEPRIATNEEYLDVTHYLLSKAMKSFWAMRACIQAGCDQDAMAVSRTLIVFPI